MKITGLLFLAMVWATWTPGASYAAPSPASDQTSAAASADTVGVHPGDARRATVDGAGKPPAGGKARDEPRARGRVAGGPNHPANHPSLAWAGHPSRLPNGRPRPLPGNALSPPGSYQPTGLAKGGFIPTGTVRSAYPVRTSSAVRPSAPAFNNERHRGPNPAVVGGSVNLHRSNTGMINGTGMARRR
jgi:hypothetical protein